MAKQAAAKKKAAKKRAATRPTRKVTTTTTSRRVQTINPRASGLDDRHAHVDGLFELDDGDLEDRVADLERENEELRAALQRHVDTRGSTCRQARIARAAANAGMTVDAWCRYCAHRAASPEVFDRSIAQKLESDRAREPHRARRLAGAD